MSGCFPSDEKVDLRKLPLDIEMFTRFTKTYETWRQACEIIIQTNSKRLAVIEDLFAGKSFKPIHDAMEIYIEDFNKRLHTLENFISQNYQRDTDTLGERLESLEELMQNGLSTHAFMILQKRIEKLETVDLNRPVEEMTPLDREHSLNKARAKTFSERIQKLEELNGKRLEENTLISRRLTEIERFQDITHLEYKGRHKTPHKCPLCHSAGFVFDITNENGLPWPNSQKIECPPCKGQGIVWG